MSKSRHKRRVNRKHSARYRLRPRNWTAQDELTLAASTIHYELSDRVRGLGSGGIGAMHLPARRTGLPDREPHRGMRTAERSGCLGT